MASRIFQLLFLGLICSVPLSSQGTGLWKSTDHVGDNERSIVRIYETNGKYYGVIEKLLPAATIKVCSGCEGEMKNKSLVGMIIIKDVTRKSSGGVNGKILDPSNGKFYDCDLELVAPDKLRVTGYLGLPILGKDMYWKRL